MVDPTTEGTWYNEIEIEVRVDLNFMKIMDKTTNDPAGWTVTSSLAGSGEAFFLEGTGPNLYGSWTWAKLLIHCEGPGSSAIQFDQDPDDTFVKITGKKEFVLEFEEPIVDQREGFSVGGIMMPTNPLAILAPYLTLLGLVATVSSVYLVWRKRKN